MKKIEYKNVDGFIFTAAFHHVFPCIHWREGDDEKRGYICFKLNEGYIVEKGEIHIFYSDNKKILDAVWNSIGLVKRALKLVHEVI